jgi:hypothetical protein
MAGKPISRIYETRILDYGVAKIFDRVENGETLKDIATSLGMSRGWLSTFLNQDPCAGECLALARANAAYKRLVARREALQLSKNGEAHLRALKMIEQRIAAGLPEAPPSAAWGTPKKNPFLHARAKATINPPSLPGAGS